MVEQAVSSQQSPAGSKSGPKSAGTKSKDTRGAPGARGKRPRKQSEYGRQLTEKQKVKETYGMRERQFRRFFGIARRSKEATGEQLLSLLERRIDNVVYRLKFASTRKQARQLVAHGHILINGKRVYTPSIIVSVDDVITLSPQTLKHESFLKDVVDKRLNTNVRVPDWLELDKAARSGRILRLPVRADVPLPVEENLIVELYSK